MAAVMGRKYVPEPRSSLAPASSHLQGCDSEQQPSVLLKGAADRAAKNGAGAGVTIGSL